MTENPLFIGQEKVRDKENEIPAIPRLLDRLEIRGATVSIDAMGIQVDIAEKIVAKGGIICWRSRRIREGCFTGSRT